MTDSRERNFFPDHPQHLGEARRSGRAYTPRFTHADLDSIVERVLAMEAQQVPAGGTESSNEPPGGDGLGPGYSILEAPCGPANITVDTSASVNGVSAAKISWDVADCGSEVVITSWEVEVRNADDPLEGTFPFRYTPIEQNVRAEPLEPGVNYEVRVRSVGALGPASEWSTWQSFTAAGDDIPPAQVTGLSVSAGLRTIVASWDNVADTDVINGKGVYIVELASDSGFTTILHTEEVAGTVVSFGDLSPETEYWVRVSAKDSSGNTGTASATASATTALADTADIQVGAITADRIASAAVEADKIQANAITAAKLNSIVLEVGKYIQSADYSYGSAGWRINATGTAHFFNVLVEGTVQSSLFQTRTSGARVELDGRPSSTSPDAIRFYAGVSGETNANTPSIRSDAGGQLRISGGTNGSSQQRIVFGTMSNGVTFDWGPVTMNGVNGGTALRIEYGALNLIRDGLNAEFINVNGSTAINSSRDMYPRFVYASNTVRAPAFQGGVGQSFLTSTSTTGMKINNSSFGNGNLQVASLFYTGSLTNNSERAAKQAIRDLAEVSADLPLLRRVSVQEWEYREDPSRRRHIGPMVEDVPELAVTNPEDESQRGIDLNRAFWTLWRAVQAIDSRLTALEAA